MSGESIYSYEEKRNDYDQSREEPFILTGLASNPVIFTELERRPKRKMPGITIR